MSCIDQDINNTKYVNAVQLIPLLVNLPNTSVVVTYDPSQVPTAYRIQAINPKIISQSVMKGVLVGAGSVIGLMMIIWMIRWLIKKK